MITFRTRTITLIPARAAKENNKTAPMHLRYMLKHIPGNTKPTRLVSVRKPPVSELHPTSIVVKGSMGIERTGGASSSSSSSSSLILTSGASGRINALFSVRALRSLLMLINASFLLLLLPFRGRRRALVASSSPEKPKDERLLQDSSSSLSSSPSPSPSSSSSSSSSSSTSSFQRKGTPTVRVPTRIVPWKTSASSGGGAMVAEGRRALAIQKASQDDDPNSVRKFSLFDTASGVTIFTQSWTPASRKIRGLVVLMHGLNEHSGRYSDFAKQLNANGFKVYGMDWIGHGGSDGLHAYVHSLDAAAADLKSFLDRVLEENPSLPCFCFGHSTGAAIVLKAVLDPKVEARVAGIVLTSPAVGVQPSHPIFVVLAPVFSFLLPRFQISAANNNGALVSRDPDALAAKYSDPLVYTGSIRVRTGYEILRITTYLRQNMNRLRVPFLVLHGTADTVTDPAASAKLYEEASSTDKTIKLLEGLLHDLLFEPEREDITNDIIEWLNCRI